MEEKKEMRMYGVLSHYIDKVWFDVAPLLEKAVAYSDGKYHLDDVYAALINRDMQLWVAYDDTGLKVCCVTQILSFPRKRVMLLVFVAGKDSDDWLHLIEKLKEFAKEHQCHTVEFYGRPGWEKTTKDIGFKKIHTIFKLDVE